ncbi:hypothetical protein ACSQ67_023755 [Phaseolus vulgaris]
MPHLGLPINEVDFNTIFGGFFGRGTSTSSRKCYGRAIMTPEARKSESSMVQGYVNLKTTFSDEHAAMTIVVRYMVVNAPSLYNLASRASILNRLEAIPSFYHMKVKLPSPEGKVITMKVD